MCIRDSVIPIVAIRPGQACHLLRRVTRSLELAYVKRELAKRPEDTSMGSSATHSLGCRKPRAHGTAAGHEAPGSRQEFARDVIIRNTKPLANRRRLSS